MKLLRRGYCRVFQEVFHFAIPFLPYRQPKILGSVAEVPEILKKKKKKAVLVVTDPGVRKLGLLNELLAVLAQEEVPCAVYDGTQANPTTENVEEALRLYRKYGCEALIGFGGGSSMDCAKAVGARLACPKKSLGRMKGILRVRRRIPLLIAVPTTAGTGSETTLACVIVDAKTRYKYAINDFPLIPRYAVLDPRVTVSLPPFLTAATGMDALTHAVEAYIGRSTTAATRKYALRAVSLIFGNLDRAFADGSDLTARRNMLHASFYAGCAFTQSYVGYVHAVAHSLGGEYNIPHGLANAILLPGVLERYGKTIRKKLAQLAVAAGLAAKETPEAEAAERFLRAIREMKRRYGIGDTVPELKEEDIPKLARYADREGNPLYPVPVLMDAEELEQIYRGVLARPSVRRKAAEETGAVPGEERA